MHASAPFVMAVWSPYGVDDWIRVVPPETVSVICAQGSEPLSRVIRRAHPRAILIAVGPEGDFDNDERAKAANSGFVAAGLGPNRLRSEPAALGAVSIAQGLLHDADDSSTAVGTE